MTKLTLLTVGTLTLSTLVHVTVAQAQPGATEAESSTTAPSQALAPTSATSTDTATLPTNPPESAPSLPPAAGSCRLGDAAGFNKNNAKTAAAIVCRELPTEATSSANSYRVDLDKLGRSLFITLSAESNGTTVDSRRIRLEQIEDVPTVTPRLIDALIHNKTLKETERFGNLTTAEVATPVRKDGKVQVGGGVLGAAAPGLSTFSPGLEIALRYDTPHWIVGGQLRCAWGVGNGDEFNMVQLGIGPRYMLSTTDTSVFIGGGMAIEHLGKLESGIGVAEDRSALERSNGGVGVYGEIGVEVMRLHHKRLNVALRTDVPFFTVADSYLVPISLTTSFLFD